MVENADDGAIVERRHWTAAVVVGSSSSSSNGSADVAAMSAVVDRTTEVMLEWVFWFLGKDTQRRSTDEEETTTSPVTIDTGLPGDFLATSRRLHGDTQILLAS